MTLVISLVWSGKPTSKNRKILLCGFLATRRWGSCKKFWSNLENLSLKTWGKRLVRRYCRSCSESTIGVEKLWYIQSRYNNHYYNNNNNNNQYNKYIRVGKRYCRPCSESTIGEEKLWNIQGVCFKWSRPKKCQPEKLWNIHIARIAKAVYTVES